MKLRLIALTLTMFTTASAFADLTDVCPRVRDLVRKEVYKSKASSHITDARRKSTSLIFIRGSVEPQKNCLKVYDSAGNLVHKMGIYARGETFYDARFYGASGCGDHKRPKRIKELALSNTGEPNVFVDYGNICVEIPDPAKCFNSAGC